MTERRAHWGDELIAAVSTKAVFEGTVTGRLHEGEVYAIIAIVEDWLYMDLKKSLKMELYSQHKRSI